jgi:hypothetical protein
MKQTLKQLIPQPLWYFIRDIYDAFRRIPELPDAYLHPWRRESIKRLAEMKDIHKGKRAFIIGTGPSLRKTDPNKIKNEITFGLNRSSSRMGIFHNVPVCHDLSSPIRE